MLFGAIENVRGIHLGLLIGEKKKSLSFSYLYIMKHILLN